MTATDGGRSERAVLQTARLTLAIPVDDDLDAIFRVHSDPETYRHVPNTALTGRTAAAVLLRQWQQHWDDEGIGYRTVRLTG